KIMQPQDNELTALAQRVRQGDFQAKAKLEERLQSSMPYIVRRVLQRGRASSSLDRSILALAREIAPSPRPGTNDPRTSSVTMELCRRVLDRLWPGQTAGPWQTTMTA